MHASQAKDDGLGKTRLDAVALRLLAHEIRGPNSVIMGYLRMHREGHLRGADLDQALLKIEQAAARVGQLGRQASDLARWLADPPQDRSTVTVAAVLERATALASGLAERLTQSVETGADTLRLSCASLEVIGQAIFACLDAAAREAIDAPIQLIAKPAVLAQGRACDILIGPIAATAWSRELSEPDAGEDLGLDRGGMGLAFILAAAVVLAHGGRLWNVGGRQGVIGVRLPAE